MIINITNAKYNGKEYSIWCSIAEDDINYADYMFKIVSPLEISNDDLKTKILNAWIFKKTNVNLNMSYIIPEPTIPVELTELEIQKKSLNSDIMDINSQIKNIIESMKEDKELQDVYDNVNSRGFISTIDNANMSDILREKYNRKIKEYTNLKIELDNKKIELKNLVV